MSTIAIRSALPAAVFIAVLGFQPLQAADTFTFDESHTEILFSWSHLGNSQSYADFREFDGEIVLDRENPSASRIDVTIDPASIDTGYDVSDTHMQGVDLFDVETYPEIRFVSTAVEPTSDTTAEVRGDLTIKDQTSEVVLNVTLNYLGDHQLAEFVPDLAGMEVAGFSATATLQRSDFGLEYLVPMVGDEVQLIIETELLRPTSTTN